MTTITKGFCKKHHDNLYADYSKYSITIYDSIEPIEEEWSEVSSVHDIFFHPDFLRCIEKCPASGITPYYCIVRDAGQPIGIVYFQSKYVRLKENLRKPGAESTTFVQKLMEPIRHGVVNSINLQTIVCGNLLLTGGYGFYFKEAISRDEQFYIVIKASEKLNQYLKSIGTESDMVLLKDFFADDTPKNGEYHTGFTKFSVQPKMILELNPAWKNFDDYMESMKSKYRVRARKALDKSKLISKRVFAAEDIAQHADQIHALYKNISDQADFNAFILHPNYFENLQLALGKNMKFTTYWLQDKMIAFYTSIKNYDVLDAHFLGYDPEENAAHQLYLNMLYDLIREGISQQVSQVDLSRTAIEIKSTVGAVPHEMYLYLKHQNPIINKTVEHILGFVKPSEAYIIRSPFRDGQTEN